MVNIRIFCVKLIIPKLLQICYNYNTQWKNINIRVL